MGTAERYDVLIVGGGPASLSAALVFGRARRRVLLVDGGAPRNRTSRAVHGLLGRDGVSPAELLADAAKDLAAYPSVEVVVETVESLNGAVDSFTARLAGGQVVEARRVVLATGIVDVLPEIPGLSERWGRSVLHCPYCHGWEVRDEPLAVLGGTTEAGYFALDLQRWSTDVVLFTNGDDALDGGVRDLLDHAGIVVEQGTIARLEGAEGGLDTVVLESDERVARRAVFVEPAMQQTSDLATQAGCRHLEDGAVEVDELGQTSVPGIYAAGDMARRATFPAPAAQVVMAAAAGSLCAIVVDKELAFVDLFS